jgi:hypothetical protein
VKEDLNDTLRFDVFIDFEIFILMGYVSCF